MIRINCIANPVLSCLYLKMFQKSSKISFYFSEPGQHLDPNDLHNVWVSPAEVGTTACAAVQLFALHCSMDTVIPGHITLYSVHLKVQKI